MNWQEIFKPGTDKYQEKDLLLELVLLFFFWEQWPVSDRIQGWMYLWPSTIVPVSLWHPSTTDRNGQVHTNSPWINESPETICCWNSVCCFYRTEAKLCSCLITFNKLAVALLSPVSSSLQLHVLKVEFGKVQKQQYEFFSQTTSTDHTLSWNPTHSLLTFVF